MIKKADGIMYVLYPKIPHSVVPKCQEGKRVSQFDFQRERQKELRVSCSHSAQWRTQKEKHISCFLSFAINKSSLFTTLKRNNNTFKLDIVHVLQAFPFYSHKFHRSTKRDCLPLPVSIC